MDKPRIRESHGAEYFIQRDIVRYLYARGWFVQRMVGHMWQSGVPDLYIGHPSWGQRWVEVKVKSHYTFTKAQRIKFPQFEQHGIGIWILVAATEEEYDKLFQAPNWRDYWKPKWDLEPTVDELLDELGIQEEELYE